MQRTTLVLAVLFLASLAFGQEPANHAVNQPSVSQGGVIQPSVAQPNVWVSTPNLAPVVQPEARLGLAREIHVAEQPSVSLRPAEQPKLIQYPTEKQPNLLPGPLNEMKK